MSFAPIRLDGGGLLQVFDIATGATTGLAGNTVALGTCIAGSDTQGYYLSTTSPIGNAWTVQNRGVGASTFWRQCASIMWSVREANTIYAAVGSNTGTNGGLLVSADAGNTWALRSGVPQFAGNWATAPPPLPAPNSNWARSTGRLLVQDSGSNWLFAGTFKQGVLRDASNGTGGFPTACTMAGVAPGTTGTPAAPAYYCRSLVQLPGTSTTLYGAFYAWDGTTLTSAVWSCTGTGAGGPHGTLPNFTKMTGSPPTPEELLVLPNGNIFAACGANGVYQYTAAAGTWRAVNGGLDLTGSYWSAIDGYTSGANDIVIAVCGHSQVNAGGAVSITAASNGTGTPSYANLTGTVRVTTTTPGGYTWWNSASPLVLGKGGFINPFIMFDPNDGTHQKVYIAGSQGMYRSADAGATWDLCNAGLPLFLGHPVAADPNHSKHIVLGDSDWGCFDDAAADGTETAATLFRDHPVLDPGTTPPTGVQGFSFAFDPTDSTVYCGIGRKYTNAIGEIYARTWTTPGAVGTWDGATPWTGFTPSLGSLGFGAAAGGSIAVGLCALRDAGGSGNRILLAAAHSGGLWRWAPTGVGGAYQWTQVSTVISAGAPLALFVGFAHVPGSAFVYCFDRNPNNVYRSGDYGATWTATPIWTAPTAATTLSGEIAAQPLTAGELWVTSGGTLYKLTGCQAGPVVQTIVSAVSNAGPVGIAANGNIYVATLDTGTGSGLLFSTNDGATFASALAVGDFSFANGNCNPEHIACGPETPPRVYVSGSNVVVAGVAGGSVQTSAPFTLLQQSGNILGGGGAIPMSFSQAGGTGSLAGSALAVRLELGDCLMTVTPPNANWVLAAEGKAGGAGTCRAQIWVYLNGPGGLGNPGPAAGTVRAAPRRVIAGRRRPSGVMSAVTTLPPSGLAAAANVGGGTFAANTYYWKITGTTAGGETTGSGEATVAVALNGTATLTWNALPAGTTGVKVYRGLAANTENVLVATLGAVTTYTDTGTAGTAATVPVVNTAAQQRAYGSGAAIPPAAAGSAGGASGPAGTPQVFTYSTAGTVVKGRLYEYTTPPGTIQFLDQPPLPLTGAVGTTPGGAGAVGSATSLGPVTAGSANTVTGGLGLAVFGAMLTTPAGQSWTAPAGWTAQGQVTNLTNVFHCDDLPADAAGTTSVTGLITLGTSVMTSWAAAVCTLYALAASPAELTTPTLPDGSTSAAYSQTVTATGGSPLYAFAVTSGTFPPGLTLASAPGLSAAITGTPTTAGTYTFSITVTDQAAQTDTDSYIVHITSPSTLAISAAPAPGAGVTGTPYAFTFGATGGTP